VHRSGQDDKYLRPVTNSVTSPQSFAAAIHASVATL
jgi:hypothetical protein